MRPIWLIESGIYGDEITPLITEIRRQGMAAELMPYRALAKGLPLNVEGQLLGPDSCVIAYGTYPFARQVQLHYPWKPGAWCNQKNLDCMTYYAHFGANLLNQNYAMMSGVEAIRQRDWLYETFGEADEVFARPTACDKLFVGRRVAREQFASILSPTRYDPETAVVIARPREIEKEWRLIVVDDRVISGSQYAFRGERAIARELPDEVRRFAESMLLKVKWRPDPVFMLDICESAGQLWLVELNSFSGSWLYQCDYAAVVAAVSARAAKSGGA